VRNLFIALLVVNLVYFVWAHWVDEPSMPPVNEALAKLPRLRLLSELPPEQRPPTATKTELNDGSSCMSVGPFDDITSAAKAAAILTDNGFAPQLRAEEAGEGYWVYVGGLQDAAAANKARINLEKKGIKDALIMPPGGDAGRIISLGFFGDRAQADQRAAAVNRLGFAAEVAEHRLPEAVYWIDMVPRPGMTVPAADLFAGGVGSRIAEQPCLARPLPTTTAAVQPEAPASATRVAAAPKRGGAAVLR
jgi:hypothetical protein